MNAQLFHSIVSALESARDKEGQPLAMDSLMISTVGGPVFEHQFKSHTGANDLRSISKPILALAIGSAIDAGLKLRGQPLTLDTLIWPFFEDRIGLVNRGNLPRLRKVRLKHLLNHTIGFPVGLMFSKDIKDRDPNTLLEYILNYEITHDPGDFFVYSNAGPYLISAIIQEELGCNLAEWVGDTLFDPLGITDFEWKNYGKYCAASSGLKISHRDMHKVGRLLVENGYVEGRQLVPAAWIAQMRSPQVLSPTMYDEARVLPKYAYGYYLWICKDGSYYCDGTDGQYLIVLPSSGTVITTFGHQADMKPITECFRILK
jgi:CubicO group peptidase (beta-lactamase class C family)